MQSSNELNGKIALVTGGSSGIGAATVRLLANAGASVVIGCNTGLERAERLKAELPGSGHSVAQFSLEDVSSIRNLALKLQAERNKIDVLVNSAGFTKPIPHSDLELLDEVLFDQILIANTRGPYSIIRALLTLLKASNDAVARLDIGQKSPEGGAVEVAAGRRHQIAERPAN